MADEEPKTEAPKKASAAGIIGMVLPAVFAGAAGFAGAMLGTPTPTVEAAQEEQVDNTPGPTVPMQPFVLSVHDADDNAHAMKVTIAIELEKEAAVADFESFTPRIRDAVITMLRALRFEDASNGETQQQLRAQLLERIKELGAVQAKEVWFTDFVMQ